MWTALRQIAAVTLLTCLVVGLILLRDAWSPAEPLRNMAIAFVAGGLYFGLLPGLGLGVLWALVHRLVFRR